MTLKSPFPGALFESLASRVLLFLISMDLIFVIIHLVHGADGFRAGLFFSIESDGGYAERFQYLKYVTIVILLGCIAIKEKRLSYIGWILLFLYFLLDDSLQVHERGGHWIGELSGFSTHLNLRPGEVGQALVSLAVGMILMPILYITYRNGTVAFKKFSQDIALLVAVLIFFGIFVDMVHSAVALTRFVTLAASMTVMEDGGEMLVLSLIVWYVLLFQRRDWDAQAYLIDWLRVRLQHRDA